MVNKRLKVKIPSNFSVLGIRTNPEGKEDKKVSIEHPRSKPSQFQT